MFNVKDGVSETTTTTGTGDFVLTARAGYIRFNDALVGNPHLFVYEAHAVDGSGVRTGAFETGIGQFFNDAGTYKIRRVRKLAGSDYPTMTPLDFAAGTKVVSLVVSAAQAAGFKVGNDQAGDPVTLYVRADGNNNNSGLVDSASGAFLTLGYAVAEALQFYESATIMVGPGTFAYAYASSVQGQVTIIGAGIGSTTISGVIAEPGQHFLISDVRFVSDGTALDADGVSSRIDAYDVDFGPADWAHVRAKNDATITLGDYVISGGATGGAHLRAETLGRVVCFGVATLTANIAFPGAWAVAERTFGLIEYDGGSIDLNGHTVTGKRYDIQYGSICNTYGGGASFLPGSVAGTTASGGQYL